MISLGAWVLHCLAITIDDGWRGAHALAQPVFRQHQMPWMLYLTTYYVEKNTQVINIAIKYILWKTAVRDVHLSDLLPGDQRVYQLTTQAIRNEVADYLYGYCDGLDEVHSRQAFVNNLAEKLGLDWQSYLDKGMFALVTPDECRALQREQVDIQKGE